MYCLSSFLWLSKFSQFPLEPHSLVQSASPRCNINCGKPMKKVLFVSKSVLQLCVLCISVSSSISTREVLISVPKSGWKVGHYAAKFVGPQGSRTQTAPMTKCRVVWIKSWTKLGLNAKPYLVKYWPLIFLACIFLAGAAQPLIFLACISVVGATWWISG